MKDRLRESRRVQENRSMPAQKIDGGQKMETEKKTEIKAEEIRGRIRRRKETKEVKDRTESRAGTSRK